jgi:hypothetical protein
LSPSCQENGGQFGWPVILTTSAARADSVSAIKAYRKRKRNMSLLYPKARYRAINSISPSDFPLFKFLAAA